MEFLFVEFSFNLVHSVGYHLFGSLLGIKLDQCGVSGGSIVNFFLGVFSLR